MTNPLLTITVAFQKRAKLASLPIALENVEFNPPATGGWLEVYVLPATPVDQTLGTEFHFEVGVTQITVIYPGGKGTGAAHTKAGEIRDLFPKGLTLIEDGLQIDVVLTPAQARGFPDNGAWRIPISVSWQAQIINP